MAKKKSEIYSALWKACDKLRGGMDSTQYKDYVLTLLFVKYISDKAKVDPDFLIEVPEKCSFDAMVKLKGKTNIGEEINKTILQGLANANESLVGIIDKVDFDDKEKLGSGKTMVDKLTDLISIFQSDDLDFSKNTAEGDDLLGDAYEYLMSKFATESGKSKGQFYTPAEVSRVIAQVLEANKITTASTTLYDPTCGSGSLLLKVANEAQADISIYGQESDITTTSLAVMNMFLHNNPTAEIVNGNTLSKPKFLEDGKLKTFHYVVSNPPFSDKSWSDGVDVEDDLYGRFEGGNIPPQKNGDYAFMLHVLKSMRQDGKGAIILPHGVLFRGNAEVVIRQNIIEKRWIKGIIGLPANLFYGTGIPACIIVLDKAEAGTRQGIFIIDASRDFIKDGNKNRLRECDIKKIVDCFVNQTEVEHYSRFVTFEEIKNNEYNLNIPRYIDSQEKEDIQDIEAHLRGGIPAFNVDDLQKYWDIFPNEKNRYFKPMKDGYYTIQEFPENCGIRILSPELEAFVTENEEKFNNWFESKEEELKNIPLHVKPKRFIRDLGQSILGTFAGVKLIDNYAVYQALMEYWQDIMQDDLYFLADNGYKAEVALSEKGNSLSCDLIPEILLHKRYFSDKLNELFEARQEADLAADKVAEFTEENYSEDSPLVDTMGGEKLSKASAGKFVKEHKENISYRDEINLLREYLNLLADKSKKDKNVKERQEELLELTAKKYKELSEEEIKDILVNDKWKKDLSALFNDYVSSLFDELENRIKELAKRYEKTLGELEQEYDELKQKVSEHLKTMGF